MGITRPLPSPICSTIITFFITTFDIMKKRSDNIQMKISLGSSLLGGKTWSRHAFFAVLITFITGDVGSASKGHGENDWSVEIA